MIIMCDKLNSMIMKKNYWQLTLVMAAGYTDPSSRKRGSFCIRPIAIMAASGRFITGEPNLPPMVPMLLNVIVPPVTSSVLSLLFDANLCNLDTSFVI